LSKGPPALSQLCTCPFAFLERYERNRDFSPIMAVGGTLLGDQAADFARILEW